MLKNPKVSPGRLIKKLWKAVVDLVFPKFCVGCGAAGSFACEKCVEGLEVVDGVENVNGMSFDRLVFALKYRGPVKKLIIQFKYKFSKEIVEILGAILRKRMAAERDWPTSPAIVPVPLHKSRLRYRGFNQAEMLAEQLGRVYDCLVRIRSTGSQAKLGRDDRMSNLNGAFAMKELADVRERDVFLVDDVATTCSTLNECSRVLKGAGARSVVAVVLARGK